MENVKTYLQYNPGSSIQTVGSCSAAATFTVKGLPDGCTVPLILASYKPRPPQVDGLPQDRIDFKAKDFPNGTYPNELGIKSIFFQDDLFLGRPESFPGGFANFLDSSNFALYSSRLLDYRVGGGQCTP